MYAQYMVYLNSIGPFLQSLSAERGAALPVFQLIDEVSSKRLLTIPAILKISLFILL